jgi:hypothetical protein
MQGQTVKAGSKLVIHWHTRLQHGMAYVMLGRSERLEDIHIAGHFDASKIRCKVAAKAASEVLSNKALNKPSNAKPWQLQVSNGLKISQLNVRSLKAHSTDLKQDFVLHNSDIICLTETWTLPEDAKKDVGLHGFVVYQETVGKGKGVAICVKDGISAKIVSSKNTPLFQHLGIQIDDLVIFVMYRSQGCDQECIQESIYDAVTASARTLILGDFNLPFNSSQYKCNMGVLCQQLGLKQYVQEPTHDAGHILDLVLSNFDIPGEYLFHHHPYYSDHDAVCLIVPIDSLLPIEVEQPEPIVFQQEEPMEVEIHQKWKKQNTSHFHNRTTYKGDDDDLLNLYLQLRLTEQQEEPIEANIPQKRKKLQSSDFHTDNIDSPQIDKGDHIDDLLDMYFQPRQTEQQEKPMEIDSPQPMIIDKGDHLDDLLDCFDF